MCQRLLIGALVCLALGWWPARAAAQTQRGDTATARQPTPPAISPATVAPSTDSALQRAEQLVGEGQAEAGRKIIDSVLAVVPPGSVQYANALYARASLALTAADAERDYRQLIVEYPSAPHVEDALLRLAQLELARGDRAQAFMHLERLTHEYAPPEGSSSASHARTEYAVARAYFDLNEVTRACGALAAAKVAAPASDIELNTRIDYAAQRCPH